MTSKKVALTLQQNENSSIKTRFAHRFLVTLSRMRRMGNRFGPAADEEIRRRSNRIKIAAYSSMARAVGSRKAWSRAFLLKIRNRARLQGNRCSASKKKRAMKIKVEEKEMSKVHMLRKLVPGGAAMDICGLLEETAHYIKCLATQVKVMQSIADRYSK